MTERRAKIEASLAERGRPAMWANEQEAAVLSGYAPERFRGALPKLEQAGFPQPDHLNGLRYIPAILNFWARRIDSATSEQAQSQTETRGTDDERQPGKWGAPPRSPPLRTGT